MKTKNGKVLVGIETEFTVIPEAFEPKHADLPNKCLALYSKIVDVMNGGLIEDYNAYFFHRVGDIDLYADEFDLQLYDDGLSGRIMTAVKDLGIEENGMILIRSDMHNGIWTFFDKKTSVLIQMKLGKMHKL